MVHYWEVSNWRQLTAMPGAAAPYWAKLWPAAVALATYLHEHPALISGKNVLELAAGLGLPSLVAAAHARSVVCSDHVPEAVEAIQRSVILNGSNNIRAMQLDWHNFPPALPFDTLVASDINYDPAQFETLHQLLQQLLLLGKTIILSTPQRLSAREFMLPLLPFVQAGNHTTIHHENIETTVSIFVLAKK